jgi:hypothetical protein
LPLLEELQQREHQVPVQLRCHQRREVVLRHGWCSELSPSCLPVSRRRLGLGFLSGSRGRRRGEERSEEGKRRRVGVGFWWFCGSAADRCRPKFKRTAR